jgi:RNA polymerase sigma-70 factor (ECF subfamily)
MSTLALDEVLAMRSMPLPQEHAPRPLPPAGQDVESTFALIRRAQAGDTSALDTLYARYLPRMQRWAHGRLPPWCRGLVETQDLVQDTLIQVSQRIGAFEPRHEGAFQGYVRQALLNRIRDEIRRARGKIIDTLESAHPDPQPSPLQEAIGAELLERYEAALVRLKPEDREAIVARVEMGMTWSEIAEAFDKNSDAAARMAVTRALVRLAREMSHGR